MTIVAPAPTASSPDSIDNVDSTVRSWSRETPEALFVVRLASAEMPDGTDMPVDDPPKMREDVDPADRFVWEPAIGGPFNASEFDPMVNKPVAASFSVPLIVADLPFVPSNWRDPLTTRLFVVMSPSIVIEALV